MWGHESYVRLVGVKGSRVLLLEIVRIVAYGMFDLEVRD